MTDSKYIVVQVKPTKIGNNTLAHHFRKLVKENKIPLSQRSATNVTDQAWVIRKHFKFIELLCERDKLGRLIDHYKLDFDDFKTVRGGSSIDIKSLKDLSIRDNNLDLTRNLLSPEREVSKSADQTLELSILAAADAALTEMSESYDETQSGLEQSVVEEQLHELQSTVMYEQGQTNDLRDGIKTEVNSFYAPVGTPKIVSSDSTQKAASQSLKIFQTDKDSELKLDTASSIPVWRKGSNELENQRLTRMFLRDIQRMKDLGIMKNEAWLINASLVKSNMTSIYEELPKEAESSIDEFIKYIKGAYGVTKTDLRKQLDDIKQAQNENPHAFLSRCINLYYEARGQAKKTIRDIAMEENEKYDVLNLYLRGLRDPKIRAALKSRIDELGLDKLAKVTQNIITANREETGSTSINAVLAEQNHLNSKLDNLTEKLTILTLDTRSRDFQKKSDRFEKYRNRSSDRNNKNKFNRYPTPGPQRKGAPRSGPTCYYCHRKGHVAKNCFKKQKCLKSGCFKKNNGCNSRKVHFSRSRSNSGSRRYQRFPSQE